MNLYNYNHIFDELFSKLSIIQNINLYSVLNTSRSLFNIDFYVNDLNFKKSKLLYRKSVLFSIMDKFV
jgi:hypothetical protein